MKKTIWIPIVIGTVSATMILLVSEAEFVIPLGDNAFMGIGEILNTLSAALGGPIAVIVTLLVTGVGHFILNIDLYSDKGFVFIVIADAAIHLCAMLVVAISYYRVLYPRARKTLGFLGGWWLTVGIYYYMILLPLQVVLLNYADPSFVATYPAFAKIFFPEFLGTAMITIMIWLASPMHYRRPQWYESKQTPDRNGEDQDEGKEGIP